MAWNGCFVFMSSIWLVNSMESYYQPPRGSSVWGYFTPPLLHREPPLSRQTPLEAMVDVTNNLGIAILQDHTFSRGNFAFSPYGVASVLVVLYEGARGESARQIHRAVGFPLDKDLIRIGFRDIHRHLRSYFSHEGYLSGISLNKETSSLKPEYKKILRFYGYDVELNQPLDEEDDDDVEFENPASPANDKIGNKTTVSTELPPVTHPSQSGTTNSSQDKDEKVVKPNPSDVENEKTTVQPTDRPKEELKPDQNSTKPDATTKMPPVEGTTPAQITTERDSEQMMETVPPTTTLGAVDEHHNKDEMSENKDKLSENKDKMSENKDKMSENKDEMSENKDKMSENKDKMSENKDEMSENKDEMSDNKDEMSENKDEMNENKEMSDNKDEMSENKDEMSDNKDEMSENKDEMSDNKDEMSENKDEMSDNKDEMSENKDEMSENQDEMSENKEDKPELTTTESMKTTVETKITTSTESLTTNVSKDELDMSSTAKNDSNGIKPGEATEELGMENITTEKSDHNTIVPSAHEEQQEMMLGPNTDSMVHTEMETEAPIVTTEAVTTESNQIKDAANLDNGMLIPQPDDFVTETHGVESQTTDAMISKRESTSENFEETTNGERHSLSETEIENLYGGKNVIRMSGKIPVATDKKNIRSIVDAKVTRWLTEKPVKPKHRRIRTITDYLKSPRSPDLSLQLQNGMYDTHVSRNANLYRGLPRLLFLVDGSVDTPVPMMTYTNVFPYAYIPKLHAKALEFPLDDIRYKLVILLPVERRGLRQLIYDLLDYPLGNVLQAMKPARVKAIVPTFMVEGFVILTSSLQKLGIWDVFDPRKANLSGMSMDPELYVRNVEQSVTVVIRNYVEILDIQTRTMAARYLDHEFEATHPFLYFVLDTATNVALMAGQILDPLNSRIY